MIFDNFANLTVKRAYARRSQLFFSQKKHKLGISGIHNAIPKHTYSNKKGETPTGYVFKLPWLFKAGRHDSTVRMPKIIWCDKIQGHGPLAQILVSIA